MPHHGEDVGVGGVVHFRRLLPVHGPLHSAAAQPVVAGDVYLTPIDVPVPMTVDRLAILLTAVAGNGRAGIYEDGGDTPTGGALVVESVSGAVAVVTHEFAIVNTPLLAGLYWLAFQFDNIATNYGRTGWSNLLRTGGTLIARRYSRFGGYGAFTDPCPATVSNAYGTLSYLRVASVP